MNGMRVLAIDGGGIRGLIPAVVLTELERRAGRRAFELFDLIAGTSTGGILACALCAPDPLPASELVKLYEEEGPEIFDRSLFQRIRSAEGLLDEKYDDAALDRALERFLGDKRLSETRPDLIVPAYDTALPGPYFFKTSKAKETPESDDFPLSRRGARDLGGADVLRAGRRRERALVDGGVFATQSGDVRPRRGSEPRGVSPRDVVLLSLGTGQRTHKRSFDEIKDWGLAAWARPILDVVFDGVVGRRGLPARAGPRPPSATGASRWSSRWRATTSTTRARTTSASCAATGGGPDRASGPPTSTPCSRS